VLILYNTIQAVATGIGLLLVVVLGRNLLQGTTVSPEGWALSLAIPGVILTVSGFHMTLTWPLGATATGPDNILFGEPSVFFGLLLSAAAFYLWQRRRSFDALADDPATGSEMFFIGPLKPFSIVVFGVGLVMLSCAIAWARYRLGAAPPTEPISGLVGNHPVLESTFMAILYGLVAVGALLFPLAVGQRHPTVLEVIGFCWVLSGVIFLLFGAMNYYTHIGDLINSTQHTNYRF
jgi:uncharacterized membrane protein